MDYKISEKVLKKDLVVPKGYHLAKTSELFLLAENNKEFKEKLSNNSFWISWFGSVRAGWLDNFNDDSIFNAFGRYVSDDGSLLGVFIKNSNKQEEKELGL